MNEERKSGGWMTATRSYTGNVVTSTRLKQNLTSEKKRKMENTETGNNVVENTDYLLSINSENENPAAPGWQFN